MVGGLSTDVNPLPHPPPHRDLGPSIAPPSQTTGMSSLVRVTQRGGDVKEPDGALSSGLSVRKAHEQPP